MKNLSLKICLSSELWTHDQVGPNVGFTSFYRAWFGCTCADVLYSCCMSHLPCPPVQRNLISPQLKPPSPLHTPPAFLTNAYAFTRMIPPTLLQLLALFRVGFVAADFTFMNPPEFQLGLDRPAWTLGSTQRLVWSSSYSEYSVSLVQITGDDSSFDGLDQIYGKSDHVENPPRAQADVPL